jgi:3-deoxy-D-manno-octulosonic-acid transferase
VVFCGGSLVPKGGQNLLEAAAWAKPIMYGPSMEDFADARQLIEAAGGAITVHNAGQMAAVATNWLRKPHLALYTGNAGRRAILAHRGAAKKHADVAAGLVKLEGSKFKV